MTSLHYNTTNTGCISRTCPCWKQPLEKTRFLTSAPLKPSCKWFKLLPRFLRFFFLLSATYLAFWLIFILSKNNEFDLSPFCMTKYFKLHLCKKKKKKKESRHKMKTWTWQQHFGGWWSGEELLCCSRVPTKTSCEETSNGIIIVLCHILAREQWSFHLNSFFHQ